QRNSQTGGIAFYLLNLIIFCAIWVVVPLLTADCISREKREGTLGLLFLTPLKALDIILGKGIIHAIRSLTLLIAGIPILTIPFLLGGITRSNVLATLLMDFAALLLSLAAGLLASSLCRQWTRSIILAEIFAGLFLYLFFALTLVSLRLVGARSNLFLALEQIIQISFNGYQGMGPTFGLSNFQIYLFFSLMLCAAIFLFGLVVLFAARRLKKTWQENPPSLRQTRMHKIFCTPRFCVAFLRRSNESKLSRNPIGWLQQYSWSARLSKWGWCFIVITFASAFLTYDVRFLYPAFGWLKTAILISMAFSAVGSFQREKQNGALELLLVTPLREGQIIFGRLRGIWAQFLPAFAILLLSMLSVESFFWHSAFERNQPVTLTWFCDFVVVPMVGLYFSMRIKTFMGAWLLTCLLTLFLPSFLIGLGMRILYANGIYPSYSSDRVVWQVVSLAENLLLMFFGIVAARFLYSRLKNRSFILGYSCLQIALTF
ncbi:MAG: hypothetical protein ACR2H1_01960, partial [Limisphaerales bacterium]